MEGPERAPPPYPDAGQATRGRGHDAALMVGMNWTAPVRKTTGGMWHGPHPRRLRAVTGR